MARLLTIKNEKLSATIAPDNGGMLVSLKVDGIETLRNKSSLLELNPMLSGGAPILFPFVSMTKDCTYKIGKNTYGMPFHGLVKNEAFGIKEVKEDEVTLFIKNNPAWLSSQYPYPFTLEITYKLTDDKISIKCSVTNDGDTTLYHAMGVHPFMLVTDKKTAKFTHYYKTNYDYVSFVDTGIAPTDMDLSLVWDHVFHTPEKHEFSLSSPKDKYEARFTFCEDFDCFVICTTQENAVCIEPWCGIPNTANSKRFIKSIEAKETKDYTFSIQLKSV